MEKPNMFAIGWFFKGCYYLKPSVCWTQPWFLSHHGWPRPRVSTVGWLVFSQAKQEAAEAERPSPRGGKFVEIHGW